MKPRLASLLFLFASAAHAGEPELPIPLSVSLGVGHAHALLGAQLEARLGSFGVSVATGTYWLWGMNGALGVKWFVPETGFFFGAHVAGYQSRATSLGYPSESILAGALMAGYRIQWSARVFSDVALGLPYSCVATMNFDVGEYPNAPGDRPVTLCQFSAYPGDPDFNYVPDVGVSIGFTFGGPD